MIEPGTRLSGRYRLDDRVSEAGGATMWKATDETLARSVCVLTFAEGFPRVSEVITAARAASRLTDSRLAQVFDAEDSAGQAYVVMEWVAGDFLDDLLVQGPLEAERAAALVAEAAEALTAAHSAGLAHLCLTPRSLMWTVGGAVKIVGLGIDAALTGRRSDDPARTDAQGLGRLLYAALTAHWPGEEQTRLPPAPRADGRPFAPRQVRAGVPGALDAVTCRALFQETRHRQPPLTTPAEVAEALAHVPRHVPLPIPAATAPPAATPSWIPQRTAPLGTEAPPPRPVYPTPSPTPPPAGAPSVITRTLAGLAVVLVMAAIGVGGWALGRAVGTGTPKPPHAASTSSTHPSGVAQLHPVSATAFDPLGHGQEHPQEAPAAIDSDPASAWHTQHYASAEFGNYKSGTGLLIDMGRQVTLREASITFGPNHGLAFQLRVGDAPDLNALTAVAGQDDAAGRVDVTVSQPRAARYVLIWITRLPPAPDGGGFQAQVSDVVLRGTG